MFANQLQEFNVLLEGCAKIKARQVRDPPLKFASVVCASRAGGGDPRPLPPHHFRPLGSLSNPRPDIGGLRKMDYYPPDNPMNTPGVNLLRP